jgi:hypothetical protein
MRGLPACKWRALGLGLVAMLGVIGVCHASSAWRIQRIELFRVSQSDGDAQASRPYFQIRTIVGADGSRLEGIGHLQVRWCDGPDACGDADPAFALGLEHATPDEVVEATVGADCTIVRHTRSADRITLRSDTYRSSGFTPGECEAGTRAPLPEKFILVSSRWVSGHPVPQR